ncbi:MAG: N-6 DNA methylase, partial [Candidatus Woesearchaeota archaeon]|nr:N-6 DNA methylase [Candidatus Woesearchaeota archaeon]
IIDNIPNTITQILKEEGIPKDKIEVLINELSFIKTDQDLNNTLILKEILEELDKNVIPLFAKETNYDILGKFYEEFLRYAGITNVKNGIILTPSHITKLFTELVEIKNNDVIFDMCCGTGAFLISAMNKIVSEINGSNIRNKAELIKKIKQNQLVGFEKSSTMYALSISNMLFRGDGKSRIYNVDSFSDEAKSVLNNLKKEGVIPTIGFINPPYGGQDNKDKPTKKEIQFLETITKRINTHSNSCF